MSLFPLFIDFCSCVKVCGVCVNGVLCCFIFSDNCLFQIFSITQYLDTYFSLSLYSLSLSLSFNSCYHLLLFIIHHIHTHIIYIFIIICCLCVVCVIIDDWRYIYIYERERTTRHYLPTTAHVSIESIDL